MKFCFCSGKDFEIRLFLVVSHMYSMGLSLFEVSLDFFRRASQSRLKSAEGVVGFLFRPKYYTNKR